VAGGKARWVSTRRRKRHTPEQVVPKLQEADRLLADGADGPEVSRKFGISQPSVADMPQS